MWAILLSNVAVRFCHTYHIIKNLGSFCCWLLLIDRFGRTMYFQLLKNLLALVVLGCLLKMLSLLVTNKSAVVVKMYVRCSMMCWANKGKNTYLCCFGVSIVLCWVIGELSVSGFLYSNCTCEDCLLSLRCCGSSLHVDSGWCSCSFSSSPLFPGTEYGVSIHLLEYLSPVLFISLIFWSNALFPVISLEANEMRIWAVMHELWAETRQIFLKQDMFFVPVPCLWSSMHFKIGFLCRWCFLLSDVVFGGWLGLWRKISW